MVDVRIDQPSGRVNPAPASADAPPRADGVPPLWSEMGTRERVAHLKTEVLLGIIVFLTQLPESVAFALLAKLTPPVGLHSAWIIGLLTSLFGGRPGMISGAAGARATIIGAFLGTPARPGLNGDGAEIVFPAVIISGGLMLGVYAFGLYRFTKIIPESVMVGFLNGIGILIALSQVFSFREDDGSAWRSGAELGYMLLICGAAVLIMELVPKIPCALSNLMPSSLLALIVGAIFEFALVRPLGSFTNTIGDVAQITAEQRFPVPFFLDAQYDLSKLPALPNVAERIFTLSVLLCAVGTIETLLTAEVVTEHVKTPNNPKARRAARRSVRAVRRRRLAHASRTHRARARRATGGSDARHGRARRAAWEGAARGTGGSCARHGRARCSCSLAVRVRGRALQLRLRLQPTTFVRAHKVVTRLQPRNDPQGRYVAAAT